MEIANLVISILSLIATIAISFVIYFLEQHNQKVSKEKEVKQEAKRFIIDNADELDYLHWATIAVGCYPQNKHIRKIYNNFAILDDEVKQEVLKQRELNCELINNDKWIYGKIDLIQKVIQELDIGDDFLYDGGKYFTRAYDYKNESVESLENIKYERDKYNDYFQLDRMFQKHSGKLTYEQYLEDYLYCKFDKPDLMPKDIDDMLVVYFSAKLNAVEDQFIGYNSKTIEDLRNIALITKGAHPLSRVKNRMAILAYFVNNGISKESYCSIQVTD